MDEAKPAVRKLLPWVIWGIGACYFLFDYMNQVVPGVISQDLESYLHINAEMVGVIASVYFLSYALLQIPIGLIVDHFGPKWPLFIAAIVATLGCVAFSFSTQAYAMILMRLFIGAGAAFSFVSCLKLVSNWFDSRLFATLTGLTNMVGMIGAIVAQAPLAYVTQTLGWRTTIECLAGIGALLTLLILLVVRNKPGPVSGKRTEPSASRGLQKSWQDLKHVFAIKEFWLIGIYAATINTAFAAVGALWGVSYIAERYQLSAVDAAGVNSLLFVGGLPVVLSSAGCRTRLACASCRCWGALCFRR
ncbi:MFS transporter [Dongshaea marina]|uniref:MFS transporter n=1 Tax=Dongshaea marina TaxID=2047966 RepID=UPI000D3E1480|nr:MFS transporter [Dongshaea marina]